MTDQKQPAPEESAVKEPVLGRTVPIPDDPESFEIDLVPNVDSDIITNARFSVPEFTSLCPKTGQPDFATIIIDYMPNKFLIESKSLKLYMFSFRNHGAYHEQVTNMIGRKLFEAALPHWMQVSAYFFPRGGIPIDVFTKWGAIPEGYSLEGIPNHNIPVYNGR